MSAFAYMAFLAPQDMGRSGRLTAFIAALQGHPGMDVVHKSTALLVLAPPETPRVEVSADGGVIIGYVFDRATSSRAVTSHSDMLAPAAQFSRSYWGGYVALRSPHLTPEVFRDPSGAVPCYHVEIDGVHVVTSVPNLLFDFKLLEPEVDWSVMAQALVYHDIKPARTALQNIAEVLPGMSGKLHPTGFETACIWSPWQFIEPTAETITFAGAVRKVRRAVTDCGTAWSGCFERPLFEISGGLDSAIVAAVAAKAPGSAAITYGPVVGDPNEVPYAKAVADHFGLELAIIDARPDLVDLKRSSAAGLPRPYARSFSQAFDQAAQHRALAIGADAFFSGGGGDSVFCHLQSLSPIFDRMASEGFGLGVLASMNDVAWLGNTSTWDIARRVIRRRLKARKPPWRVDHRLLNQDAVKTLPFPRETPWARVPDTVPPGKAAHVYSVMMIQNFLEGFPQTKVAPIISPLLSQPVMEACLAVPTWLWCTGGVNRAVARSAFASSLPPSVLARRGKGAFDSFAAKLIVTNRPAIRDLLFGGLLSKQGLLDEPAIENALSDDGAPHRVRIAQLVDAEAWARSWNVTTASEGAAS
ncbi:asparagine synthase-related protein [Sphingomonas glacialis]|uniref:asparagine synthase (glutamine-hydrolyzing) n=1 Tax=Sphingomonas glacialis TaxID=658225 RepID=A0A502FTC1_9SPHN|nr:asparagine synthase-related protein [Sphingomonas glacialis]TPG52233.1 hypothetical protein EAH76_16215 [Sphingomonas glacialis]